MKTQQIKVINSNCSKLKYQRVEEDKFLIWKGGNFSKQNER